MGGDAGRDGPAPHAGTGELVPKALEAIPSAVLYGAWNRIRDAAGEADMLDGRYEEVWDGHQRAPWNWTDEVVGAGGVRDRMRRWWRSRGGESDRRGVRDGDAFEAFTHCVECGDRFPSILGTVRCQSCCDQE